MTLSTLIKNVHIQGSITISVWSDGDEVFRETIHDDDRIAKYNVEEISSDLLRMNILYMYPINDEIVVEVDGSSIKRLKKTL